MNATLSSARRQSPLGACPQPGGVHFAVWAPDKDRVDVVVEQRGRKQKPFALKKSPEGVFSGVHPQARVEDVYWFQVDGGPLTPDPASRFQPQGVHGPSLIVDPKRFKWNDSAWPGIPLSDLVIYELHVGTFTPAGTFSGVLEKLSHLKQLGVTALELMPLADFPGQRNWGYDGVCLFAPARCYGAPDDLRRLVDAAHRNGLAVLIDVVYNHLGPDGNYTGVYSPYYVSSRHQTAWGPAMNLEDDHHEAVREFFIENALHWVQEYHVDGLRLDATHALVDTSPHPFLAELTTRVRASAPGRTLHIFAEDNRNLLTLIQPVSEGGWGCTGVWSDDFHHQIRRLTAGDHEGYFIDFTDRIGELAETVLQGWFYQGQESAFFKAPRGTPTQGAPLEKFVVFIQNHDQIGNRALGERLHQNIDAAVYRAVSALLLCGPETPLLFMGQEWAAQSPFLYFTDHEPALGKKVSEGRKAEFQTFSAFTGGAGIPDPQALETFEQSRLSWDEKLREPHASVWLFYSALLKLRHEVLAPYERREQVAVTLLSESTLLLKRFSRAQQPVWVIVHLKGPLRVNLPEDPLFPGLAWDVILTSEEKAFCQNPEAPVIQLAGPAPVVEFSRPGVVVLKAREAATA